MTAKNRKYFDPFYKDAEVVQTIDESTSVLRLTESPQMDVIGMFSREFTLLSHGRSKDEKCYVIVVNSVALPNMVPDVTRGKIIGSGWVIEQAAKGTSQVTYNLTVIFFFFFFFFCQLSLSSHSHPFSFATA